MQRLAMLIGLIATGLVSAAPTYTKDVAPILNKHCVACHRPGEIGPFSLMSYKDTAKRADFLADIVASRRMPPWHAEPGFGKFHGERRLTDAEIATFKEWAAAGAPEGAAKDLPATPTFASGWKLGPPDLIIKMPKPFTVPASGRDILQCFVMPIPIEDDKFVAAVDFHPGNRTVVHHVIFFLDASGQGRKKAGDSGSYRSFGGPGILPTGGLGAWVPGANVLPYPDGVATFLRKGSDMVMQVHFHPSGKEETDQSEIGIYFAKKPVEKVIAGIGLRKGGLYIPAGEKNYRVSMQLEPLPADVQVLSIAPHMHYIGREMKVVAQLPDKTETPLIWIKDWDFNWQGKYYFEKPVKLPKGTIVKMEASYDNSEDNPQNPSKPPKPVRWGEQTTDEMCLCGLQVVTDNKADMVKIARMSGSRLGTLLGGGVTPADLPNLEKAGGGKPTDGIPIPERFEKLLGRFDTNKDGKLSDAEIDAMPPAIRDKVREYVPKKEK
jgi:hypothetical protein